MCVPVAFAPGSSRAPAVACAGVSAAHPAPPYHQPRLDATPLQAIRHAEECACGPAAAGLDLPRLLFTFAHKEWKQGDAAVAATLLKRVLALAPANHYALALLANIRAEAKQVGAGAGMGWGMEELVGQGVYVALVGKRVVPGWWVHGRHSLRCMVGHDGVLTGAGVAKAGS